MSTPEADPTQTHALVLYDDSLERLDNQIDLNEDNLDHILKLFPQIDPSKLFVRIVGFYDDEYGMLYDEESGITTITIGGRNAKAATKALSNALSEITSTIKAGAFTENLIEATTTIDEFTNKSNTSFGFVAGAAPGLLFAPVVGAIAESLSAPKQASRKLAKQALKYPLY